jgi:Tfp pilus assembly protein PilW
MMGDEHKYNFRRAAGLSIVEVMISLTIAAMLLTAVAAAFTASSDVIEHNDQFFRACQAARVSMNLMLTQVRRAHSVDMVTTTDIDLKYPNPTDPTNAAAALSYSYHYDAATQQIKFINNADGKEYRLAGNVVECRFDREMPGTTITRVTISLRVQVGDNSIRLSGSAAPRKAQNL